jgi:mannosyltransferase
MATVRPRRSPISLRELPGLPDFGAPAWFERLPQPIAIGGVTAVLIGISAFIRTRFIGGQLWFEEANAIGIAMHPLTRIPALLRHGGGAPLYYLLLHYWIDVFGAGETATHWLSLLLGLLAIPLALWLGWSLLGRRAGLIAATLLAFSAFFTTYADETAPYELLALLGLLAVAAFVHAFIDRRRRWVIVFCACLALMLYTDDAAVFFWFGSAAALIWLLATGRDRRRLALDALACYGVAALVYLPWLPTVVHQALHATDPFHYAPLLGATVPRNLLGSDRVYVTLAVAVVVGLAPLLLTSARRRSRDGRILLALSVIVVASLVVERLASFGAPAWAMRYMGPAAAALLLLCAFGCARSAVVGLAAVVLACVFTADPGSFVAAHKSDMRDVAAQLAGDLRPGDTVVVAQPEQAPLAYYYLPAGLRYYTALGADTHPSWMNWDGAYARLRAANPRIQEARLVASLRPGQRLLFIRPLTEGERAWRPAWAALVRRRAAQWGAALSSDPRLRVLPGSWAPQTYYGSCCISSSALIYQRVRTPSRGPRLPARTSSASAAAGIGPRKQSANLAPYL